MLTNLTLKITMYTKTEQTDHYKGEDIFNISLHNDAGMIVTILNFGAIIKEILFPYGNGSRRNMVLSYPDDRQYYTDPHYIGCVVGRYANRIAGGKLILGDEMYQLSLNENGNSHLHGGFTGFNKKVWHIAGTFTDNDSASVTLTATSPHLEEGYPGYLTVEITYTLTRSNELQIHYRAVTDKPTIVNLTNHTYFNLSGGERDISNNTLSVNADAYTPANDQYIPTGNIEGVEHSGFDLRTPVKVSEIMHRMPTINYCLSHNDSPAAILIDSESGCRLEVRTTKPGLQLYFANYLDKPFTPFAGICLEPQFYPDSPNHPLFPSTLLVPGQTYEHSTWYRFF
ncbi:galactose mutarotase [Pedobacter sp. BS3]|uniref:aldose epimerase family protein n=1 Tax=Pedobacter sp. BS3 TaxID=2567937 RepID=UPI0011EEC7A9|nr:aldose epimerase family protein [Pedobacter sp. BS3]TZF82090.1 galactose mutarotase [Pedobacter sp. BS3]